ncbi:glycoside hydrolase family 16 protein [Cucurbitaria berberidis CBS 394.84]|uniref:endo-1,3(4)-beta-glucanase n=1 Tax=Cucurbitaria berberidis CBS 394.84 TaxID=1168544 RepID=A0A9P4G6J0_9PLEO|nr:glycoside hydrolase family 16 protein [Cucurbitaria berberidis CBS 394.84]KAF1839927.1 glycoside hydrolase family 16 protein [Cucurbitaria berberidis CBS 394.84]
MRFFSTFASAAALFELSIAGYVLEDDYMTDFYGGFDFFTGADPTEGFVQYVDEATARQTNLINASMTTAVQWGVDSQKKTPKGRPSVRIESKKTYDSGLIVLDVAHMPFGCGTWPAFWTVGPNWPKNGEIDILEGVNEMDHNGMTLHTGPNCAIGQDTAQFSGEVTTPNCDVAAEDQSKNVGCSIKHPSKQSYGAGLNKIGGGVYATQWTADAISVYFFPRDSIPADVLGDSPDPSGWGLPAAKFTGSCDIEKTFKEQKIVFDTTFCGQWAGKIWGSGSCAKKATTCEEYVRDNPEAFAEAYWTVNALKVYQDNGEATNPSPPTKPSQSIAISLPLPIPTNNSSFSTRAPPSLPKTSAPVPISTASDVVAPVPTTDTSSKVPSETAIVSATRLPNNGSASRVSSASLPNSKTQAGSGSARQTRATGAPIAAPTGANGMPGFQWPLGGAGQPGNAPTTTAVASPSKVTQSPVQNTTIGSVAASSTAQSVAQPSAIPVVSNAPAPIPTDTKDAPLAILSVPIVTDIVEAIQTVYHTVYVTVPSAAEETPAPAAKKARMARHIREHRQRLTRHNMRM